VIEIGRRLADCKERVGHGRWLPWLQREFGWTEMTATRFINVHEMSKSENFSDFDIPVSGLYLLAAPSTPEEVREAVIERAEAGEAMPVAEIERMDWHGRESPPCQEMPIFYGAKVFDGRGVGFGFTLIVSSRARWWGRIAQGNPMWRFPSRLPDVEFGEHMSRHLATSFTPTADQALASTGRNRPRPL